MNVVVRTDASALIGSGHVVRCLCLADSLHARGAAVSFVSRTMPEHLRRAIAARGHRLVPLPDGDTGSEALDARQTLDVCGPSDWVVVDHYGLGAEWETIVRSAGRVLAIDDLARPHACDALLDQNFHPGPERRYAGRVPKGCRLMLGPRYALLRKEFEQARPHAVVRDGAVKRLHVFLGGMDAGNVTETVLRAVDAVQRPDLALDVVIGATHPARARIEQHVASRAGARCHVDTPDMAALLVHADLAIGAGGTATWERCALGVPTLGLCLAENQRELLLEGSRHGFVHAPDIAFDDADAIALHLRALLDSDGWRHQLSRVGLELVDGRGAQRVAASLLAPPVTLRRATRSDARRLHDWRNAPSIRAVSDNAAEIPYAEHERWLDGVLGSATRHLLIGELDGEPVGVVRFDELAGCAEVSIYLLPMRIGRGEGPSLLLAAEAWLQGERPEVPMLQAHVQTGNTASHHLFDRCGYERHSTKYVKRIRS